MTDRCPTCGLKLPRPRNDTATAKNRDRVLDLLAKDFSFLEIARACGVSKGVVAGIAWRDRRAA
jgi:hypothetical protein